MKLRQKLSLYFTLLTVAVMLVVMLTVYYSLKGQLAQDFYEKLEDRVNTFAQTQLRADKLDSMLLSSLKLKSLQELPQEVIRIYGKDNRQVFLTDSDRYWTDDVINRVRAMRQLRFKDGEMSAYGALEYDDGVPYVVIASANDTEGRERLANLADVMLALFLLAALLGYIGGVWLARRLLQGLDYLVLQVKNIKASSLHTRIPLSNNNDEVGMLAAEFNNLLEHLQKAFELQQTYNANASHELRTPITSIIGSAEVALQKERSAEEYRAVLYDIVQDAALLKSTVAALMELSIVEMGIAEINYELLRADELLFELDELWSRRLYPGCIRIKISTLPDDESCLMLRANKGLLHIAFNNIIGNAFKYSENKPVSLSLILGDESITINVTDSGPGINAYDLPHIYQPFYRGGNVKHIAGTGLGLYVAQVIASLFNAALHISSAGEGGTVAGITFKTESVRG